MVIKNFQPQRVVVKGLVLLNKKQDHNANIDPAIAQHRWTPDLDENHTLSGKTINVGAMT